MNANETADIPARRPRLMLASAVMFVADLDRSVMFYQELLGLEATTRSDEAALLVSPDGYQLYLRSIGKRAQHFTGAVGIQYLGRVAGPRAKQSRSAEEHVRGHRKRLWRSDRWMRRERVPAGFVQVR